MSKWISSQQPNLPHRRDSGGFFWEGPGNNMYAGSPFTTIHSVMMLHELGVDPSHEAMQGAAALLLGSWKPDGRFRVASGTPGFQTARSSWRARTGN